MQRNEIKGADPDYGKSEFLKITVFRNLVKFSPMESVKSFGGIECLPSQKLKEAIFFPDSSNLTYLPH